jgi:hypothetical protein
MTDQELDPLVPHIMFICDIISSQACIREDLAQGKEPPASGYRDFAYSVDARMMWVRALLDLEKNPEHDGDCTNQCHTCVRCYVEMQREEARKIVDFIELLMLWYL